MPLVVFVHGLGGISSKVFGCMFCGDFIFGLGSIDNPTFSNSTLVMPPPC